MSRKKERRTREKANEAPAKNQFKDHVVVQAKTQGQKQYIIDIKNNDITFCHGPAGTGKTAVAIGLGLQYILAPQPSYEKIVILRPAREACDEHIGFLPGDAGEKLQPWVAPVIDNALVFCSQSQIKNLMYERKIEIIPLAFARGRSLNSAFVIVDEAQNLSCSQMLLLLTRLGQGSKMVISGDLNQSDIHGPNGMDDALARLRDIPGIAFCELDVTDIVRHPLIGKIIERYQKPLAGNGVPPAE